MIALRALGLSGWKSRMSGVGDNITKQNAAWSFGDDIPDHFDAHITKSVPSYAAGQDIILALSDFFIHDQSVVYELGSATGTLTLKLANRHCKGAQFIGIDCEAAMTHRAKQRLPQLAQVHRVSFITEDIVLFDYQPSDFIVAYYTVQFVPPRVRQQLFDRIYHSLNWGGAFVLFEKVRSPDARFQDIITSLYTDFKLQQGYSAEEIIAKSRSLKGVLEPFSTSGNLDMLQRAGFVDVMTLFKYLCFEGFFCIK